METLYYLRYHSNVTDLLLGASEKGLVVLEFDRGQFPAKKSRYEWIESPAHLKFWLRRVTSHRCIDHARKKYKMKTVSVDDAPEPVAPAMTCW